MNKRIKNQAAPGYSKRTSENGYSMSCGTSIFSRNGLFLSGIDRIATVDFQLFGYIFSDSGLMCI